MVQANDGKVTCRIEEWTETHPRWSELLHYIESEGETHLAFIQFPWHQASHLFVALENGEFVGLMRFTVQPIGPELDCPPVTLDGEELLEAKTLCFKVRDDKQRRGIGRALQQHAVARARELGCYQIRSYSSNDKMGNHRLKLKMGFCAQPELRDASKPEGKGLYFVLPLRTVQI